MSSPQIPTRSRLASTPISPRADLELTRPVLRSTHDDLDALAGRRYRVGISAEDIWMFLGVNRTRVLAAGLDAPT